MWKFITIIGLLIFQQGAISQQIMPAITVKKINNKNIISWTYPKPSVTTIIIQRSFDSIKNFKTISSIADVKKDHNEFIDAEPPSQPVFYRLFISFQGGKYIYTPAVCSDTIAKHFSPERKKIILAHAQIIKDSTKQNAGTNTLDPTNDTNKIVKLKEVKVLTKKQLIEQDVDKLIYHADADPESRIMSALDLLRKVPMVTIDAEDNIEVNGSSNYQVLINGKASSLFLRNPSDIFKGMPASIIKDIEVITNPPSKYEAAGVGGIINIITNRKNISGYNGSINIAASSPRGFTGNGYFTAKPGKLNISTYFGSANNTNPISSSYFLREDKLRYNTLQQTGESNSTSKNYNAGFELNYELDSFNTITSSFNLNAGNAANNFKQQAQVLNATGNVTEQYTYLNSSINKWTSKDIGVSYQHTFKNNASQMLSLAYIFNTNSGSGPSDFVRRYISSNTSSESNTDNNNYLREHILQADYVHPFKKNIFEAGFKSTLGFNTSNYFYKNFDTTSGKFILDTAQSNSFEYRQNIHAAYVSFNIKKNNWGVKAGARVEETLINAKFRSTGTLAKQDYINLIPNIILSQKLKGTSTLRLSYTQRIERPMLNFLNPYVYIIDPKNIGYGNPKLSAAVSNVFNLAYNAFVKGTSVNANLFYNFSNNSIQQFTFLGADTIARSTYGNIAANKTIGISLGGNTTFFKKLNINVNTTSSYVSYTSRVISKPRKGFVFNVSGYSNYSFTKGWRASGNIGYSTASILLQGSSAGYIWNSLSVFKDFLQDNRTTFSFSITSPFSKYRHLFTELKDPAFYQLQQSYSEIRRYTLSFNYRFAKVQAENIAKKIAEVNN